MSHFYGGIQGQRGPATRMGSAGSGFGAYAQNWHTRISVDLSHDHEAEADSASIHIGTGPSNYNGSGMYINIRDIDKFLDAVSTDDTKIKKHLMKIRQSFQIIQDEAEGAIRRQARRDKIKRNREERERKAEEARRAELKASITAKERKNFITLVEGYTPDLTNEEIDSQIMRIEYNHGAPERNDDGHLIVKRWQGGGFGHYASYNLTTGQILEPAVH